MLGGDVLLATTVSKPRWLIPPFQQCKQFLLGRTCRCFLIVVGRRCVPVTFLLAASAQPLCCACAPAGQRLLALGD